MYTFCIIMIAIASVLLILAVLVQSPKSGMAANFGAANQTMGVRQTSDFLEKFTWAMVAAIVLFTLLSVTAMPSEKNAEKAFNPVTESKEVVAEPTTLAIPAEGAEATTEAPATEATTETPATEATTAEQK
jgi:preprotein translocase subunit SecG